MRETKSLTLEVNEKLCESLIKFLDFAPLSFSQIVKDDVQTLVIISKR